MSAPRASVFAAVVLSSALSACGSRSPDAVFVPSPRPPVAFMTIVPVFANLRVGDTIRFTATLPVPPGPPAGWTWTSSDVTKATVDSTGLARAVAPVSTGVGICASPKPDTGVRGCATVVTTP